MNKDKIIDSIKQKFKFMKLSSSYILKTIDKALSTRSDPNVSEQVIIEYIEKYYYKLIAKKTINNDLKCINKYIDYYKDDKNLVERVDSFLKNLHVELPFSVYVNLFKENSFLNNAVSKIVGNNYHEYYENYLLSAYCVINSAVDEENLHDLDEKIDNDSDIKYDGAFKIYLREIEKYPMLDAKEQRELLLQYRNYGDMAAREKLVNCNARLVVSCAKKYYYRCKDSLQMMDLVIEGNIGLMNAIDKFDISLTYNLTTYAVFWIRQRIDRCIDNSGILRVPVNIRHGYRKYCAVKQQLSSEVGRDVTDEEVAKKLDISVSKIREYGKASQSVVNIDQSVGEDDDAKLGDFIADEKGIDDNFEVITDLRRVMDLVNLSDKERAVITIRYGLDGSSTTTLEETAMELYRLGITENHVTRERIRQIEAKALKKLRNNNRIRQLGVYCGLDIDNHSNVLRYPSNTYNRNSDNRNSDSRNNISKCASNNRKISESSETSKNVNCENSIDENKLKSGKIYEYFKNLPFNLVYDALKAVINFNREIILKYNSGLKLSKYEESVFYNIVLPKIRTQLLICVENNEKNNIDILNPNISFYNDSTGNFNRIIENLKLGNYLDARKLLEDMSSDKNYNYFKCYGLLERLENNYDQSMEYYNRCMGFKKYQSSSFIELANLNIQMGNNDIGRKMLETLFGDKDYHFKSKINTIYLDILEGEYKHAYELLNKISIPNLNQDELYIYNFISKFLDLRFGVPQFSARYSYSYRCLLENYNLLYVLDHLSKEENFINGINHENFLQDMAGKIVGVNANHYALFDMYKFHLDSPIGYCCCNLTSDVCVTTQIGTKNIIDIKPIILSQGYDLDDNLHSEKLRVKRK